MYWKPSKKSTEEAPEESRQRMKKPASLTLRLTLLFALTSAAVLLLLGLLIGQAVEDHFEEQDLEILTSKLNLARQLLENEEKHQALSLKRHTHLIEQLNTALTGHHDLILTIHRIDGPAASPHLIYENHPLAWPSPTSQELTASGRSLRWSEPEGMTWRSLEERFTTPSGQRYQLRAATAISHHEHFMGAFRRTLWIFMACAALAMGALGGLAVRRGLTPLKSLRDGAAAITAHRLDSRLPTQAIPSELSPLVLSLNAMLGRLETSFQRLSDFSSDLAHELRTPVSNLLTQTQVSLSKARTPEAYQDILASNAEELERLSRMIADMLYLAKADNQQLILHRETVILEEEVASLLEYYDILAEEKNITLRLEAQGEGCRRLRGDRLMLRRAIQNLLSNALRHTPTGGQITVSVGENQGNRSAEKPALKLCVENSGPPIPEDIQPRLFDRFFRGDPSRQRTHEGSGLGLAITRSLVEAHGGWIELESDECSTRFTLIFPKESESPGA